MASAWHPAVAKVGASAITGSRRRNGQSLQVLHHVHRVIESLQWLTAQHTSDSSLLIIWPFCSRARAAA
eukprot:15674-Heterococcus_DN1.PRE.2